MKRRILIFYTVAFFLIAFSHTVYAMDDVFQEKYESLDIDEMSSFINKINSDYGDFIPAYSFGDLIGILRTEKSYDVKTLLKGSINYFASETIHSSKLLLQLVSLTIICAVLNNIQSSFDDSSISQVTRSVVYLVLLTVVIQSFNAAIGVGKAAIDEMVGFIQAVLPLIFTLLASLGNISTVAIFKPLIFMGVTITGSWIKDILLPFISLTAVLSVVGNISDRIHISMLTNLLKQTSIFLLGSFTSVFLGVVAVQGAGLATVDGISIRTAKFATKNFIPFVGSFFSDTVDIVMGCSLILKNVVGVIGLIMIFILTLFPIAKILSLVLIYKLAGAIIQPLGEGHIVKCLDEIGNCLMLILVSVASVSLMFFVTITFIVISGNISVMLR